MKAARRSTAFASGVLMFCACNVAAIQMARAGLPRQWYVSLGGKNSLPVMMGESLAIALVLFGLALLWSFLTLRPTRRRHRPNLAWLMSGVLLAWTGWLMYGALTLAASPKSYLQPLNSLLFNSSAAPLFGIFNIFAVLIAVNLAGRMAVRRQLSLPSTRSARRSKDAGDPTESLQMEPAASSPLDRT